MMTACRRADLAFTRSQCSKEYTLNDMATDMIDVAVVLEGMGNDCTHGDEGDGRVEEKCGGS